MRIRAAYRYARTILKLWAGLIGIEPWVNAYPFIGGHREFKDRWAMYKYWTHRPWLKWYNRL